jgi:hypothetical protein
MQARHTCQENLQAYIGFRRSLPLTRKRLSLALPREQLRFSSEKSKISMIITPMDKQLKHFQIEYILINPCKNSKLPDSFAENV